MIHRLLPIALAVTCAERENDSRWAYRIDSALLRHLPGTNLPAVVLRGPERLQLRLPIQ